MSQTTKRVCRISVTLRPDKVYLITLDHYVDHLVPLRLMKYLIPLVREYCGMEMDTKLEYENFGKFTEEIIHIGFEIWGDFGGGILYLNKAICLTPNDEALTDLISQLRICFQSQEISKKLGDSLKSLIKEELEKKNYDLNKAGYATLCSTASYIIEDACNYAKHTLVF